MPAPLTSIIPAGTWWCRDVADAAAKNIIGMPGNPARPKKFWRDNSVTAAWWMPSGQTYTMLARNADGSAKLTPVGSEAFLRSYTSLSVVNTYRQYSFLFPQGVPYTVQREVAAEDADLNFVGTDPAIDYPLSVWANHMLVIEGGQVVVYDYQEFARTKSVPATLTTDQRLMAIANVLRSAMQRDAQLAAIREICTISGNGNFTLT